MTTPGGGRGATEGCRRSPDLPNALPTCPTFASHRVPALRVIPGLVPGTHAAFPRMVALEGRTVSSARGGRGATPGMTTSGGWTPDPPGVAVTRRTCPALCRPAQPSPRTAFPSSESFPALGREPMRRVRGGWRPIEALHPPRGMGSRDKPGNDYEEVWAHGRGDSGRRIDRELHVGCNSREKRPSQMTQDRDFATRRYVRTSRRKRVPASLLFDLRGHHPRRDACQH